MMRRVLTTAATFGAGFTLLACPAPSPVDAGTDLPSRDAGAYAMFDGGDATDDGGQPSHDGGTIGGDGGRTAPIDSGSDIGALDAGQDADSGAMLDGGAPAPDGGPSAGWTTLSDIAVGPRQETGVAVVGDALYVVGGYDDTFTFYDTLLRYDVITSQWSTAAALPQPMHHPHVVAAEGKLYVLGYLAGGFGAQGGTYVYDPAVNAWTSLTWLSPVRQRGGGVAGLIGDKIIVAGGLRGGAVTDVDAYDLLTDQWTELAPLPEPLDHTFGGVIAGELIVAGGRNTNISALSGETYVYNPGSDTWASRAAMPTPRAGGASAVLGGTLFTLGGEGNAALSSGVFDNVEAYSAATDSWTVLDPMPFPRHGMAAGAHADAIYVPGGADVQAFAAVATFDALRPAVP